MEKLRQPETGIQYPFPGRPRDDEGNRHGIQEDRAQATFRPDALVEQNGEAQPDRHAQDNVQRRIDTQVDDRNVPARMFPDASVLHQATPVQIGKGA